MISASNGGEAIELAKREVPQLIILDMVLPDVDGRTVREELQKTEATTTIPVIMVSGSPDLLAQEQQSGQTVVLAKPINAEQLLMFVRRLIPGTEEG